MIPFKILACFNSSMVQLMQGQEQAMIDIATMFQFLNGSINVNTALENLSNKGVSIPQWFN